MIATYEDLKFERFLRNRLSKNLVWKDKLGNIQSITELSDEHLENILKSFHKSEENSKNIKASVFSFY